MIKNTRKRSSQKELSDNNIKKESPPKKTKIMNLENEKKSTIRKSFSQKELSDKTIKKESSPKKIKIINLENEEKSTKNIVYEKDLVKPKEENCNIVLDSYGYPGSSFSKKDLQILDQNVFINDNIIKFYSTYLIQNSSCPRRFYLADSLITTLFDKDRSLQIKCNQENTIFVPLNVNNQHWQLLVIINVYDSTKDIVIFILDSLKNNFSKTRSYFHINGYTRETTQELQVEYVKRFTVALVSYLNPDKVIPEIIYMDSV